ncbi:MAG: hypothetical protein HKL80_05505 [Acidimicrobiales bacterium]|nr:hypothetical protein [Acidimicrobiales bacterium]
MISEQFLEQVLSESQKMGFIGGGPLDQHLTHSRDFLSAIDEISAGGQNKKGFSIVDMGSGGGLPGIPLAAWIEKANFRLIESSLKRSRFLQSIVEEAGETTRVEVVNKSAESAARENKFRETQDLLVSRLFGPISVALECGSPFIRVSGILIISKYPEPKYNLKNEHPAVLETLGLEELEEWSNGRSTFAIFRKVSQVSQDYPRKTGLPRKRPLFSVSRETL